MSQPEELVDMNVEEETESPQDNEATTRGKKPPGKSEKKHEQVDVLRESLIRIETNLEELTAKRKKEKPREREHFPNTYNSLASYGDTHTVDFVVFGPSKPRKEKYLTKNTAISMCDPWESHRMDVVIEERRVYLPPGKDKNQVKNENEPKQSHRHRHHHHRHQPHHETSEQPEENETDTVEPQENQEDQENKVDNTNQEETNENNDETEEKVPSSNKNEKTKAKEVKNTKRKSSLYFDEVPQIRKELREKHSMHANAKIEGDYNKTKKDYYHKKLDRMEAIHPRSRDNVKQSYFAYLQNTPGSKKAVKECIRETEVKLKKTARSRSCSSCSSSRSVSHENGKAKQTANEGEKDEDAQSGHEKSGEESRPASQAGGPAEEDGTHTEERQAKKSSTGNQPRERKTQPKKSVASTSKAVSSEKKKPQKSDVDIKFQYQRKYPAKTTSEKPKEKPVVNKSSDKPASRPSSSNVTNQQPSSE